MTVLTHGSILTVIRHLLSWRPISNTWHIEASPLQPLATIVFVHGIYGHHKDTWNHLLDLISKDPELPAFEIASWGWTTGAILGGGNSINVEGRRLLSEIGQRVPQGRSIILVGHSMGGLAIFDGLTAMMRDTLAQQHPCINVDSIVLYATPMNGTQVASVIGWPLRLLRLGSPQIRQLSREEYADELLREVVNRIYRPAGQQASANSERRIPIVAVVATDDKVVSVSSARSVFNDPPPVTVSGGHTGCKAPASRSDSRYIPLQRIAQRVFDRWFMEKCQQARFGSTEGQLQAAYRELHHQCESMLSWFLGQHPRVKFAEQSREAQSTLVRNLLTILIEVCAEPKNGLPLPVSVALNQSIWFIADGAL
jgi:pimeloyl-ACP methyl ester carboxylesterase